MIVETKSVPLSPATFAALVELRKIFHRTQIADFEPLARFSGLGELRFLFRSMLDLVCSVSFQKVSGNENVWESFRFLTIQKNLPDGMATWRDRCNRTSGPRAFSPGHTKHLLRAAYRSGYSPRSDVAFYAAAMAGQALERMPKPVPAASDMPTNCQYVFPTGKNHALRRQRLWVRPPPSACFGRLLTDENFDKFSPGIAGVEIPITRLEGNVSSSKKRQHRGHFRRHRRVGLASKTGML